MQVLAPVCSQKINTFAAFARVNKPNMHTFSLTHSPSLSLSSVSEMESAPRNVQVRPLSSSTMVITWEPPETPNGQVTVSTWHQVRILNNNSRTQSESRVSTQTPDSGSGQESTLCHRGTAKGSWLENGQMTLASRRQSGRQSRRGSV